MVLLFEVVVSLKDEFERLRAHFSNTTWGAFGAWYPVLLIPDTVSDVEKFASNFPVSLLNATPALVDSPLQLILEWNDVQRIKPAFLHVFCVPEYDAYCVVLYRFSDSGDPESEVHTVFNRLEDIFDRHPINFHTAAYMFAVLKPEIGFATPLKP